MRKAVADILVLKGAWVEEALGGEGCAFLYSFERRNLYEFEKEEQKRTCIGRLRVRFSK